MTFKTPLILSTVGLLALTACVPADPYGAPAAPAGPRTQSGALIGAMAGGLLGSQSSDDRLLKTAVGAGIGAVVGGAIGATLDAQAAELRGINGQFNVTNMGDYLVVNMPQDVLFAVDSAALRPDLQDDIRSVAQNLLRYPNSQIQIIGHTDNTGAASYNQDLSQRRAVSVANGPAGQRCAVEPRHRLWPGRGSANRIEPDAGRPRPEPSRGNHHPPDQLIPDGKPWQRPGQVPGLFHCEAPRFGHKFRPIRGCSCRFTRSRPKSCRNP